MDTTMPDRVIDETNAKTKILGPVTVLYLDDKVVGQLYADATVGWENPVPVWRFNGSPDKPDTIGTAVLARDGNKITAQIFLDYNTPERFDIEAGTPLWPHIASANAMDTSQKEWRVAHCQILAISLESFEGPDDRVVSL